MKDGTSFVKERILKDTKNGTYPSEYDIPSPDGEYEFFVKSVNELGEAKDIPKIVRAFTGKERKLFVFFQLFKEYLSKFLTP